MQLLQTSVCFRFGTRSQFKFAFYGSECDLVLSFKVSVNPACQRVAFSVFACVSIHPSFFVIDAHMKAVQTAQTNIFNKRYDKVLFSVGKFVCCSCTTKIITFDKVTENESNKTKSEITQ